MSRLIVRVVEFSQRRAIIVLGAIILVARVGWNQCGPPSRD